jgi:hypothetical protein
MSEEGEPPAPRFDTNRMKTILRNLLAVVVGLLVGGGVNMALVIVGPYFIPPPPGMSHRRLPLEIGSWGGFQWQRERNARKRLSSRKAARAPARCRIG